MSASERTWLRFTSWADRNPERMTTVLLPVGYVLWAASSAVHLAWSLAERGISECLARIHKLAQNSDGGRA